MIEIELHKKYILFYWQNGRSLMAIIKICQQAPSILITLGIILIEKQNL